MHFAGPDQLHGYEQRLTTDIYPSDFGWTPNWAEPDAKVTFQDMQNVLEVGPCARSMQIDYDDEVSYHANRWLFDQARSHSDQPFMLTVSFTSPHDPYVAQPEFWDLYQNEEIDLPAVSSIPLEQADPHSRRIREHYRIDQVEVTEDSLRRLRHGYYAAISYIDSKVAQLMQTLKNSGLMKNTIVFFTSDHGDMMGERGLYYKKTFFEWAIRVPLVVWSPGRYPAARVSDPVSLLDILPTFQEMSGSRVEDLLDCDGISLLDSLQGKPLANRTIAAEYLAEGVFNPTFMLRDKHYKYFYSKDDPALMFEMKDDPLELENLGNDPDHVVARESFQQTAARLWNPDEIKQAIIHDQKRRRLINKTHKIGQRPHWDFQPMTDASHQWVRAGVWTVEAEAKSHLDVQKLKSLF